MEINSWFKPDLNPGTLQDADNKEGEDWMEAKWGVIPNLHHFQS